MFPNANSGAIHGASLTLSKSQRGSDNLTLRLVGEKLATKKLWHRTHPWTRFNSSKWRRARAVYWAASIRSTGFRDCWCCLRNWSRGPSSRNSVTSDVGWTTTPIIWTIKSLLMWIQSSMILRVDWVSFFPFSLLTMTFLSFNWNKSTVKWFASFLVNDSKEMGCKNFPRMTTGSVAVGVTSTSWLGSLQISRRGQWSFSDGGRGLIVTLITPKIHCLTWESNSLGVSKDLSLRSVLYFESFVVVILMVLTEFRGSNSKTSIFISLSCLWDVLLKI